MSVYQLRLNLSLADLLYTTTNPVSIMQSVTSVASCKDSCG